MATRNNDRPKKLPKAANQRISLKTAIDLTSRYRRSAPASEKGGFFFLDGLQKLLAQPGVMGMRFYHGLDAKGRYRLVLVGVDRDGNDIVKARTVPNAKVARAASGSADAILIDGHFPCPPWCPPNSPL